MDAPSAVEAQSTDKPPTHVSRQLVLGGTLGVAALAAFLTQIALGIQQPWIILAINLGLAAGAYAVVLLHDSRLGDAASAGILQFLGYLAIALLGRVWLGQTAQGIAILFEYSLSLAAVSIVVACLLFRLLCNHMGPKRAALANGITGGLAFLLLVTSLLASSHTLQGTNVVLLELTCLIVPSLLGVQWAVARRLSQERAKTLGTPLALALAGTQLFDGVLTYLVVVDPLGIAPEGYEEQILVSRIILERFGVGFALLKWALGIGLALFLFQSRFRIPTHRVVTYVAIFAAGLGPFLYSAAQLF